MFAQPVDVQQSRTGRGNQPESHTTVVPEDLSWSSELDMFVMELYV